MTRMGETWIDPEEFAYGQRGGVYRRRGKARLLHNSYHRGDENLPYGQIVSFKASIADTYWSVPAKIRIKGKTIVCYVRLGDSEFEILPEGNSQFPAYNCPTCGELMTFTQDYCEETGERMFKCEDCGHETQEDLLSRGGD